MNLEPLSHVDAAWLHMEDPSNLMMVTGVLAFDEPLEFEQLTRTIGERLLSYPRFRQRVVEPHGPFGSPCWELDPGFDLHAHVHRVALPRPGGQAALQDLVSDLMSTPLDFSKPLWQFHLVEGYGTGCAVLGRLHHAIADGIALMEVLLSLADEAEPVPHTEPDPEPPDVWQRLGGALSETLVRPALDSFKVALGMPPEGRTSTRSTQGFATGLLEPAVQAVSRAVHSAEGALHEGLEWVRHPERALALVDHAAKGADALGKLLLMSPDPRTAFKGPLGVAKRAAWSDHIRLDEVKAVGRALGATVNDVLLAVATGALRRYISRGEPLYDLEVRAVVPVNLRSAQEAHTLGNRFGLVFLPLPVGIEDPLDRLFELKQRMDAIKQSPEAVVALGLLGAIGRAPVEIEHLVLNVLGARGTAVMTNVCGPRRPISLAGKRITSLMFWVPQSGHLGLGLSILSYAGGVSIGVATDAGLVPDPERLVAHFRDEFAELLAIVRRDEALVRDLAHAPPAVADTSGRASETKRPEVLEHVAAERRGPRKRRVSPGQRKRTPRQRRH